MEIECDSLDVLEGREREQEAERERMRVCVATRLYRAMIGNFYTVDQDSKEFRFCKAIAVEIERATTP